jgi:hypothetical protein
VHGAPVYRLRGNLLSLVYLNRELHFASSAAQDSAQQDVVNIAVLQADDCQFGLIVDEVNDTEEIVVKPLGKLLKGLSIYTGATIMGDGRVPAEESMAPCRNVRRDSEIIETLFREKTNEEMWRFTSTVLDCQDSRLLQST